MGKLKKWAKNPLMWIVLVMALMIYLIMSVFRPSKD